MSSNLSAFLNFSRWFAACLVLVGHCRHLILVDLKNVLEPTLFIKGVYFVTGFGHEAVVVFFVLSGFLVGGTTLSRWQRSGVDPKRYAIARMTRIYTVLIPALVVGGALDLVGLVWVNASELYTLPGKYHTISLDAAPAGALTIANFAGSLAMLNGWLTQTFGSNTPLWSLAYECWYYLLFALFAAGWVSQPRRVVWPILALVLLVLIPFPMALWGLIWSLGLLAHGWLQTSKWRPHPALGGLVLLMALTVSRLSHNVDNTAHHESLATEFSRDLFLGLAYVVALVSATRLRDFPFQGFHRWAADFSFTSYLMHFPAMMLLTALGYQFLDLNIQVQPDASGLLHWLVITALVYCYCYLMSLLAERHTGKVRDAVTSLVGNTCARIAKSRS